MRAAVGGQARRCWGLAAIICVGILEPRAIAGAQVIRGTVVDAETKTPVGGVTITIRGTLDSVVTSVQTSTSGQFRADLKQPGRYSLDLRRVGWVELKTTAGAVAAGDTVTIALELARLPIALDTVVSVDKSSVFPTTPGREFVRRHFAQNEGLQIGGWQIEKSGLSLSDYLGKYVPGIHTTDLIQPYNPQNPSQITPPAIPAEHGRFIMADSGSQCLYARVDRYSLVYLLYNKDVESIDELLSVKNIMAVEVFRSPREVPPEWKSDARVNSLFSRRNNGEVYLIGDTGFPAINVAGLQDQSINLQGFQQAQDSIARANANRTNTPGNGPGGLAPAQAMPTAPAGVYDLDAYGLQPVVAAPPQALAGFVQAPTLAPGEAIMTPTNATIAAPVCAFLQIWTYSAW